MKKIMIILVLSLFLVLTASSALAVEKPDLKADGMTAICGDVGEVCEFRVIIRNLRPVNADEFKVKFEISPSTYDLLEGYSTVRQVSGLAAGGQTIVDIKFAPEQKTTYTVKAIVDSANDVAETNENNNDFTTEHSVPPAGYAGEGLPPPGAQNVPDLNLFGLTSGNVGDPGENITISAWIKNAGADIAGNFKVKYEITPSTYTLVEGTMAETYSNVEYNQQFAKIIKLIFHQEGKYTLTAKADVDNQITESNENNNQETTEIYVGEVSYAEPEEPEPREVMEPTATPEKCGVQEEFRDKTDTALLAFWAPGETPKWAHGKEYGKLYLKGGYWVELVSIVGNTATIKVDGETATISKGQSKEIDGVVIYAYDVGSDYIDYCIHETKKRYVELTCDGCMADSKCLPIGTRILVDGKPSYCNIDKELVDQGGEDVLCQNSYECRSNWCIDGKCVSPGLLTKILQWFKNLFG